MRSNDFDEFMVRRDYHANNSSKRHTPLDKSRFNVFVNSRDASGGTVSTSSDDRLSLPTKGQDNSTYAFNSLYHAGSQFKVYSGESKSSVSRSEILTAVSDGQAGRFISCYRIQS